MSTIALNTPGVTDAFIYPGLSLNGSTGWQVNQGPGPQVPWNIPTVEYPTTPDVDWLQTVYQSGENPLIMTPDSNPEQEIF